MKVRSVLASLVVIAALGLTSCGGDTGPGGEFTEQEVAALVTALTTAGIPLGSDQFVLEPVLTGAEVGALGPYSAIAAQVYFTVVSGSASGSYPWIGVIGWNGFNAGTGTVAQAFGASYLDFSDAFPAAFTGDLAEGSVLAWAHNTSPIAHYYPGETGTFSMTAASFGSASDCENPPELGEGIEITECRVAFGEMQGRVGFSAERVSGTGPETFVFEDAAYDLPAVRLELTVDYTNAAAARAAR